MADVRIYDVPVTLLDGKERTFRYTLGSMRRLKALGFDIMTATDTEVLDHLHEFVWAGLAWQDASLTPDEVADLIPLAGAEGIMQTAFKAFERAKTPETPPDPTPPASETMPAMT